MAKLTEGESTPKHKTGNVL